MISMLATTPIDIPSVEAIDDLSKTANTYGFMTIFSIIALLVLVIFFVNWQKSSAKKQTMEVSILEQERKASIEQNHQMFDFTTKVQTQQVVQLQQMTDTLKTISINITENNNHILESMTDIKNIETTVKEISEQDTDIKHMIDDILEYVKTSDNCNKEILIKVEAIEKQLHKLIKTDKNN